MDSLKVENKKIYIKKKFSPDHDIRINASKREPCTTISVNEGHRFYCRRLRLNVGWEFTLKRGNYLEKAHFIGQISGETS